MSYHRFTDVPSSSPEVEISPSPCTTRLSGYEQYSQTGGQAEQHDVFPDVGEEVLGSFLGAQAWSVDTFVECNSRSKPLLTNAKPQEEKEHSYTGTVEEKFIRKEAIPPSLSNVLTTYSAVGGNISVEKSCNVPQLRYDNAITVDGNLPQTIEDRQTLLEGVAESRNQNECASTQQSSLSSESTVDRNTEIVDSSNSDNDLETGNEDATQKKKNKKRYVFLSPKKGSTKNKVAQDSVNGSCKPSQDMRPLINDDDLQED